jgi:hypothetical protein
MAKNLHSNLLFDEFIFACFLSMTLCPGVLLVFYKTGHSHMMADRVVAWCRKYTRGVNLYNGDEMVDCWNKVKSVNAQFISHEDPKRPFHVRWESVLGKYLKKLPTGFTNNHCFEFFEGKCIMRELCSLDRPGLEHQFTPHYQTGAKAMLRDLFGVDSIENVSLSRMCLPTHQGNPIEEKSLNRCPSST